MSLPVRFTGFIDTDSGKAKLVQDEDTGTPGYSSGPGDWHKRGDGGKDFRKREFSNSAKRLRRDIPHPTDAQRKAQQAQFETNFNGMFNGVTTFLRGLPVREKQPSSDSGDPNEASIPDPIPKGDLPIQDEPNHTLSPNPLDNENIQNGGHDDPFNTNPHQENIHEPRPLRKDSNDSDDLERENRKHQSDGDQDRWKRSSKSAQTHQKRNPRGRKVFSHE